MMSAEAGSCAMRAGLAVDGRLERGVCRYVQHALAVDPDLAPVAQPGDIVGARIIPQPASATALRRPQITEASSPNEMVKCRPTEHRELRLVVRHAGTFG